MIKKIFINYLKKDAQQEQNIGVNFRKISKSIIHEKNLTMSQCIHQLNRTICSLRKKQKEELKKKKKEEKKTLIRYVHNSLIKYSKNKNNIDNLMLSNNKTSFITCPDNQNITPTMLERKYNIPISIKYSTLKQFQQICEAKEKKYQIQQKNYFVKQPLIKQIKKIQINFIPPQNQHHVNHSLSANKDNTFSNKIIPKRQRKTQKYKHHKSFQSLSYEQDQNYIISKPAGQKTLTKINRRNLKFNSTLNICSEDSSNQLIEKNLMKNQYIRMKL